MPWLSRESEEEIDGVLVPQQDMSTREVRHDRTGSLSRRLKLGTKKNAGLEARGTVGVVSGVESCPLFCCVDVWFLLGSGRVFVIFCSPWFLCHSGYI